MSVEAPPQPSVPLFAPPEVVPDLSRYVTQDDTPVESFYHARQQVLLVESLISSWSGPGGGRRFFVPKNVGFYHTANQPALVPDVLLALDVEFGTDYSLPENRSYFQWVIGKPPDLAIEVVSLTVGGEDTEKLRLYERVGVPYYAIFDPEHHLGPTELRVFGRVGRAYQAIAADHMTDLGLGLVVWEGTYAGETARWLRWIDANGVLIPTGAERAALAELAVEDMTLRAKAAVQRTDREKQRAEAEKQRADLADDRIRKLEEKIARYSAKLHDAGLNSNGE